MNTLSSTLHGYLDYLTVVVFFFAPAVLSLSPEAAQTCYILAGVHLAMTLITDFELGWLNLVPLKIHGGVELIVSLALLIGCWFVPFFTVVDQFFFSLAGTVIFIVWLVTRYSSEKDQEKEREENSMDRTYRPPE